MCKFLSILHIFIIFARGRKTLEKHDGNVCNNTYLSGVEVDKAVAPWLSLQGPGLMEQEIKLLHIAKLFQQLHQVVPAGTLQRSMAWRRAQDATVHFSPHKVLYCGCKTVRKKLITCSWWPADGTTGYNVVSKDGWCTTTEPYYIKALSTFFSACLGLLRTQALFWGHYRFLCKVNILKKQQKKNSTYCVYMCGHVTWRAWGSSSLHTCSLSFS